jgi:MFS transporter, putative metabolite transport protein
MSEPITATGLDAPAQGRFRRKVTLLSGMGLFLDGFDLTVIAAAGFLIVDHFHLNGSVLGLVNASALIGMFFGSLFVGRLTDRIGRRKMYLIDLIGFVVFAVLTAVAQETWELIAARLLLGVCIGADYAISSTLTAEFGGKTDRGRLVVSMSALSNFGNVIAYVVAIILVPTGPSAWRWMLLVGAVLALLSAFARSTIPESPRWLISQGRTAEAAAILKRITGETLQSLEAAEPTPPAAWGQLFSRRYFGRIFFVCAFWFLFGVAYYGISLFSPQIVSSIAGSNQTLTFVGSGLIALLGVVGVFIGFSLVDRWGRRKNIITGFTVMVVALLILTFLGGKAPEWLVVVLVGGTIMGSQVGPGTLNLLYPAELFPTGLRASAVGFGTAVSRIGSILGVLVFPALVDSWGLDKALWLFVGVAALGLLVSILMAPETKGRTLEETSGDHAVAAGFVAADEGRRARDRAV